MSKHVSIEKFTSPDYPEVEFTLRKFSYGLRAKLRRSLSNALSLVREKSDEVDALIEEGEFDAPVNDAGADGIIQLNNESLVEIETAVATIKPPKKVPLFSANQIQIVHQIQDVRNEIDIITAEEVDPAYLRVSIISIVGLEVDGKPITEWSDLYEFGPEDLCDQVIKKIKTLAGITVAVNENLKSPSISGAPVDGQMNATIAPSANDLVGTVVGTATSTSLS